MGLTQKRDGLVDDRVILCMFGNELEGWNGKSWIPLEELWNGGKKGCVFLD